MAEDTRLRYFRAKTARGPFYKRQGFERGCGMKTCSLITFAPLISSAAFALAQTESFPVVQTETAYLDTCEQEWGQREPAAAPWARAEC